MLLALNFSAKKQFSQKQADRLLSVFRGPIDWQGKTAPDFKIDLVSGHEFHLADNIGRKVIVLNFFATWCGPCREETPELVRYFKKHRKEQFIMVGINADEDKEKVRDFMAQFNVTYPVGIDRGDKIEKLFGIRGFPTTVFIGADGVIKVYEVGPVMNADVSFDAILKKNISLIDAGKGIDRNTYLANLKKQQTTMSGNSVKTGNDKYKLTGRAKSIAAKMYCPCGCSDALTDCNCKTARNAKEKLKTYKLAGKTDEEVIKDLNKEFCVRGND